MSCYAFSIGHVERVVAKCRRARVSAPESFWRSPPFFLRQCYNGIGPEAWSRFFRDWVTETLEEYEVAAIVHDYEYATGVRRYWAFTIANVRLSYNAWREACWRYPHDARCRRRMTWIGALLAVVCQLLGWRGYKSTEILTPPALGETKERREA